MNLLLDQHLWLFHGFLTFNVLLSNLCLLRDFRLFHKDATLQLEWKKKSGYKVCVTCNDLILQFGDCVIHLYLLGLVLTSLTIILGCEQIKNKSIMKDQAQVHDKGGDNKTLNIINK